MNNEANPIAHMPAGRRRHDCGTGEKGGVEDFTICQDSRIDRY